MLPEPIPTVNPTAWITAIAENTTPTAAPALVPIRATKKVSAMLYSEETSILTTVGTARRVISRGTGVCVIVWYWLLLLPVSCGNVPVSSI